MTGSGLSVLVIETSAEALTVVVAVALLLPGTGSPVAEVTVAVFESTVPAAVAGATATVRVKTLEPTATVAFEQLTVPPLPTLGVVHDQPATAGCD